MHVNCRPTAACQEGGVQAPGPKGRGHQDREFLETWGPALGRVGLGPGLWTHSDGITISKGNCKSGRTCHNPRNVTTATVPEY